MQARARRFLTVIACFALAATLVGDAAWKWSGSFGNRAVELLILGDIQVHTRRADPLTAFNRVRDTLKKADLCLRQSRGTARQVRR